MAVVYSPAGTKCTATGDLLKSLKKSGWTSKEPTEQADEAPSEESSSK